MLVISLPYYDRYKNILLMLRIIKENINGILGTVIFHLIIVLMILVTRLSSFDHQLEQTLLIEFDQDISAEEFAAITESLQSDESFLQDDESGHSARNIAVDVSEERPVPDQFRDLSSQQLSELDQRVDEVLNNAANGADLFPEHPEIETESTAEIIPQENNNDHPYTGPTTITYDLQGRTHLRIPVPVYKCPDGGIVEVNINVNQQGRVVDVNIDGSPENFNEMCIFETATQAAMASRFTESTEAPSVQSGTITFYFQKQ